MGSEETNAKKIINALERLKKKHKGQYLDNICDVCTNEHGWERETTMTAIEVAIKRGLIHETVMNNEVSYCITSTPMVTIHDNTVPVCTQTDFHETTRDDDLHNLQTQFLEFKRYAFDELAVLRSKQSTVDSEDNYLKPLLRSMEHRIISLERQLEDKQRIIEKLIAGPKQIHPEVPPEVNTAPVGISEESGHKRKEKKLPQKKNETRENKGNQSTPKSNNSCVLKDKDAIENVNNKNIVFEDITTESNSSSKNKQNRANKRKRQAQKRKNSVDKTVADCANLSSSEKQTSTNDGEKRKKELRDAILEHSQSSGDSTSDEIKEPPQTDKKKIMILGDSMVKNIHSWKLRAALRQNVVVRSFPGAKTNDMMHYIKPAADKNPDLFIIHCGTNDLRSETSAETVANNISKVALSLQKENATILISGICPRGDDLNEKAHKVNEKLKDICNSRNIGYINNNNLEASKHLNNSKLHLNRYGDSVLARNFREAIQKI